MPIPASLRLFSKRPAFIIASIGIVALGVALAATAASILDALVFRSIPVPGITQMYRVNSGVYRGKASPPDARDVIERIEDVPAFSYSHMFSVEFSVEDNSKLVTLCELQGDAFKVGGGSTEIEIMRAKELLPASKNQIRLFPIRCSWIVSLNIYVIPIRIRRVISTCMLFRSEMRLGPNRAPPLGKLTFWSGSSEYCS